MTNTNGAPTEPDPHRAMGSAESRPVPDLQVPQGDHTPVFGQPPAQSPTYGQPTQVPVFGQPPAQGAPPLGWPQAGPPMTPPMAAPTPGAPHNTPSGEATFGKYALAGAAALLVFLAAGSLITLLWDQISDLSKVSIVGVIAVLLTAAGFVLGVRNVSSISKRNVVPSATLLGTGGGLGFLAIIGAVLLDVILSPYVSLALLCGWAVVLVLLGARTRIPMTWIIAAIGGIASIVLTASFADREPSQALMSLVATFAYVITLIALTYFTSSSCTSPRSRPWYLVSSLAVTITALIEARTDVASRTNSTVTNLVIIGFVLAMLVQYALISSVVPADPSQHHGWGIGWLSAPIVIMLTIAKQNSQLVTWNEEPAHWPQLGLAGAIIIAVAVASVLTIERVIRLWASHSLFAVTCIWIILFSTSNTTEKMPIWVSIALYFALAATAIPAARTGHAVHAITLPLAFPFLFNAERNTTWTDFAFFAIFGIVTIVTSIAIDELARKTSPAVRPAAVPSRADMMPVRAPWTIGDVDAAQKPSRVSRASTWILALLLILLAQNVVKKLDGLMSFSNHWDETLTSIIILLLIAVFIFMGLSTNSLTPFAFFSGKGLLGRSFPQELTVPVVHSPFVGGYPQIGPVASTAMPAPGPVPATAPMPVPAPVPMPTTGSQIIRRLPVAPILVAVLTFILIPGIALLQRAADDTSLLSRIGPYLVAVFILVLGGAVVWMLVPLVRTAVGDFMTGVAVTVSLGSSVWLASKDLSSFLPFNIALILTGAACIALGFRVGAKHLRLYGLILVIVIVIKFAVIDMWRQTQNPVVHTVALLVAGIICFILSVVYSRFSSRFSDEPASRAPVADAPGIVAGGSPTAAAYQGQGTAPQQTQAGVPLPPQDFATVPPMPSRPQGAPMAQGTPSSGQQPMPGQIQQGQFGQPLAHPPADSASQTPSGDTSPWDSHVN